MLKKSNSIQGEIILKNSTSIKVPKKYQPMVEDIYKDSDKGYWCYANKGYYFSDMDYGVHIIREDTQRQVLDMIKSLRLCECDDCIKYEF